MIMLQSFQPKVKYFPAHLWAALVSCPVPVLRLFVSLLQRPASCGYHFHPILMNYSGRTDGPLSTVITSRLFVFHFIWIVSCVHHWRSLSPLIPFKVLKSLSFHIHNVLAQFLSEMFFLACFIVRSKMSWSRRACCYDYLVSRVCHAAMSEMWRQLVRGALA